MTEEVQNLAETPAPIEEATAAPAIDDTFVPEEKPAEAPKTFTQEDLDAIVSKRLAREQRKWEREQRQRQSQPYRPEAVPDEIPPADQFESVDAYAEALAQKKAVELVEAREMERQQAEILFAYHDREEDARNRYDDFEQVAYNPNLSITNVMAQTIQASDVGPDVAYYLGVNPKEADRIARLPPFMQAKEIGKIEAKVAENPPIKKTSNAPAPIAPVTPRGGNATSYDTTDPRSVKAMSTSEWIEAERKRQIKAWEAKHLR